MTKLQLSQAKFNHMTRLSNSDQVIAALAIDQRGALKRLLLQQVVANLEMTF